MTESFRVRVLRQDKTGESPSYWETFLVPYEPHMNVISVLQKIAELGKTIDGHKVAPVAWECNCLEEICGSCTMLINGRVRQACSALVDQLLVEKPQEIGLQPVTKFPVVRDLVVDRRRMFSTLQKIQAWVPVDSYLDRGPGPRQSQQQQRLAYLYNKCMTCGCCLEACPQYTKVEPQFYDRAFIGAFAIAQVESFDLNPTGSTTADERLDALIAEGGIQVCGNAQNCVRVCPKEIPLTTAIGRQGRAATWHILRRWFDR